MRYAFAVLALLVSVFYFVRYARTHAEEQHISRAPLLSAQTADANSGTPFLVQGAVSGGSGAAMVASATYARTGRNSEWHKLSSHVQPFDIIVAGVGTVHVVGSYQLQTEPPTRYGYSNDMLRDVGVKNDDRVAAFGLLELDRTQNVRTLQAETITAGTPDSLSSQLRWNAWWDAALGALFLAGSVASLLIPSTSLQTGDLPGLLFNMFTR